MVGVGGSNPLVPTTSLKLEISLYALIDLNGSGKPGQ